MSIIQENIISIIQYKLIANLIQGMSWRYVLKFYPVYPVFLHLPAVSYIRDFHHLDHYMDCKQAHTCRTDRNCNYSQVDHMGHIQVVRIGHNQDGHMDHKQAYHMDHNQA